MRKILNYSFVFQNRIAKDGRLYFVGEDYSLSRYNHIIIKAALTRAQEKLMENEVRKYYLI